MSTLKVNAIQDTSGNVQPFGITMNESWMLTSSFNGNGEADITSNWGKHSAGNSAQGDIGTGMTESSGITTDGSNFTENVESFSNGYQNTAFLQVHITGVYDVTNTSTHKIKFQHNISDTVSVKGSASIKTTGVVFTRLGDT